MVRKGLLAAWMVLIFQAISLGQPAAVGETPGTILVEELPARPARFWLSADALLWWVRPGPVAIPLVTTGPAANPRAGFFDEPSTRVLLGNDRIHYGASGGFRLDGGWWFDEDRTLGLQVNGFVLQQRVRSASIASGDDQGNPVLSRPVNNIAGGLSGESVYDISYPNQLVGFFGASSASQLGGVEINLLGLAVNGPRFTADFIAGFRYLGLSEDLFLTHDSSSLVADRLSYQGYLQPAGSELIVNDYFWANNHFYGGQIGTKLNWEFGSFHLGLTGKLALGGTQHSIKVDGTTLLIAPDGSVYSYPGGVLAATSNFGRHESWNFSMVPELDLNLGWQLTNHLRLNFGYSFLFWTNVLRPGNVLDRTVDGGNILSDPWYGLSNQGRPGLTTRRSDFWTQGFNLGLEFRF